MNRKNDITCYSETGEHGDTTLLLLFNRGIKCESWDEDFCFYYDENEGNHATDFLANDKGWFLVSDKLRKVLESLNTEIQFLPVKIVESKCKKELPNYYIANILRVVDALCLEKSVYSEVYIEKLGTIYNVIKYGIYAEKTENSDVFKLAKRQEIPIFVSENLKNKVEEVTFFNSAHEIIFSECYPMEPAINQVADNVFEVSVSVGSPAAYAFYVDMVNAEISETFFNPLFFGARYIAYMEDSELILRDVFNDDLLYIAISRDFTKTANPMSAIVSVKMQGKDAIELSYYKGDNYEETSEIMTIP